MKNPLSLRALLGAHYKAWFRPIKLLFAHDSTRYAAKSPGHETATSQGAPMGPEPGWRRELAEMQKRPGKSPAVCNENFILRLQAATSPPSATEPDCPKATADKRSRRHARYPLECRQSPSRCPARSPWDWRGTC